MNSADWNWRRAFIHGWAVLTACCTLLLLWSGGLVTSKGVGMAVPDWPNTFGYNMFLFPFSQWVGGIFFEHSHRLVATGVGLLTSILVGSLWAYETRGRQRWLALGGIFLVLVLLGVRELPVYITLASLAPILIVFGLLRFRRNPDQLRWLGLVAFAAVILQGVLGGLRVVLYKDEIGIFHGLLAQAFLLTLAIIAVLTSRAFVEKRWAHYSPDRVLFRLALATTLIVYFQLGLGATMRHEHIGLSIPDFPTAYGGFLPDTSAATMARINAERVAAGQPATTAVQVWVQMAHRFTALAIFLLVVTIFWRAFTAAHPRTTRFWASVWLGLVLLQVVLGAWTIWSNKAADIATGHVAVGALILVVGGTLTLRLFCGLRTGDFAWPDASKRPLMNVA